VEDHRRLGAAQLKGDLLGRQPFADQMQTFAFPLRQVEDRAFAG
jgi:hypothetical protein